MGLPGGELLGTVAPLLVGTSEMSHTVGEKRAGSGITTVSNQSHFSA